MEGKVKWRMGEGEVKEEKCRKYLHGWHVTEILTSFCMFDCDEHCRT